MPKGNSHSILRIRTFDDDVSRARGIEVQEIPRVAKKKVTAQDVANVALKDDVRSATQFIDRRKAEVTVIPPKKPDTLLQDSVSVPPLTSKIKPSIEPAPVDISHVIETNLPSGLEEEVQKITSKHSPSVLTSENIIYDVSNNDLSEGTLITNKKKHTFKLFPAIAASVKSWFSDTVTKVAQPKKVESSVKKAESRIATITEAARSSKQAPRSDYGVVIKRLKKKKTVKKAEEELPVKKKVGVPVPIWSSFEKTSQEAPVIATASKTEVTPIPETFTPVADVVEVPEVPKMEAVLPMEEVTIAQTSVEDERKEEIPSVQQVVPQKKRTYAPAPATKSGVPIYAYILVIIGASLLGIGVSVYWFMSVTPTEEAVAIRIPSLFISDSEVPMTLQSNGRTNLSTILDLSLSSRETTHVYPTVTDASGFEIPADAQTILTALELRAPGSFIRSVTGVTFGGYNGTDPFILMKVTNFDTAFGGLLEWELDMSNDLTPLFGTPVTQSYDPYAHTDTQVRSAFFRDTIVANKSARLLVDAQDNERLIYAFINPNLILITSNADALASILPLVTQ